MNMHMMHESIFWGFPFRACVRGVAPPTIADSAISYKRYI